MSVVFLALQESLKRHVALKVLRVRDGVTETMADRFIHEAETVAQLDHPNVVGIYDVGQAEDGSLWYTMPFLDHGDLRGYRYEGDDRKVIELISALCDGLGYAHEHRVVHRDIKPENVLFDKFGNAQIADFGIAVTDGNRRWTKEGQVIGSVDYMSPEQCQARAVDHRTDIYSVGVILWEMLTGEVPFDAEDEMGVMLAHVSEPLPDLPWPLRHWQPILRRCLAKSPDQRYQSAAELGQALRRLPTGVGRSVAQGKATVRGALRRWRMPLAVGAAALVLVGALASSWYFWRLAQRTPPVVVQAPAAVPASTPERAEPPAISEDQALQLVEEATLAISEDRLTLPADDNAADRLVVVLSSYPGHAGAIEALVALGERYRGLIETALEEADHAAAAELAEALAAVWRRTGLAAERFQDTLEATRSAVGAAIAREADRLDADGALAARAVWAALAPDADDPEVWDRWLSRLPQPGQRVPDSQGVDTLFVARRLQRPDGTTRTAEAGFAMMDREVDVAQYRLFVEQRGWPDSSCRGRGEAPSGFRPRDWRDPGFTQGDDHPVVCVSWNDAVAYAEWLSARSGNLYRLPSEDEWIHAAWIGNESDSACLTGNVAGTELAESIEAPLSCSDGVVTTAPSGQFEANRIGLFDLRGNAREWVEDCAPTDTGFNRFLDRLNIKEADPCDRRTVRGTGWLDGSGVRMLDLVRHEEADEARNYIGFRLVRDLVAEHERERARDQALSSR